MQALARLPVRGESNLLDVIGDQGQMSIWLQS